MGSLGAERTLKRADEAKAIRSLRACKPQEAGI